MKFTAKFLQATASEESPYQEIADPVCVCSHTFLSHDGRSCDHCDCNGYYPASMKKQVMHVCEYRSFGTVNVKKNPMVFARDTGERLGRILKVYLSNDEGRVVKAEYQEDKKSKPIVREGWEGFFSFTQAYGD